MNKKLGWSVCLLALALCSMPAMAGTLYSNLGTGTDVYNCCVGWTISGTGTLGFSQSIGDEFQVTSNGNISEIDVAVGYVEGTNAFKVSLNMDNNGLPGMALETWDDLQSPYTFGNCCDLLMIQNLNIPVSTNTNYWLVVAPENSSSTLWGAWNFSNSTNGNQAVSTDGGVTWSNGGFTNQGAFQVLGGGGTTPEPTSLLLLGSGLVAAIAAFRRKIKL